MQSKTVIKRKITQYNNRGFAFSGEAGNDKRITDSLSSRVAAGLFKKIEQQAKITFNPLVMSVDEDLPKNNRIQETSDCGSMYEPESKMLLSPVSESGRKDHYVNAATSLKDDHIGRIEERPDSEDTASDFNQRKPDGSQ